MTDIVNPVRFVFIVSVFVLSGVALAQPNVDAERCTSATGSVDDTLAACTRAIESKKFADGNLAILLNSRAVSWREKGSDGQAMADFDEAIKRDPKYAMAYSNRGNLHGDLGDNDRAIADYNTAIKLNPKLASAYSNRAVSLLQKGEPDRAIADLDVAIKLVPDMLDAWNNRGFAWRAKGDPHRALADFNQVIKLDPKFADAYDSLALIHATSADAKARNGKRAVELAQRACELTGFKNAFYLNTLAAAHAEAGDFKSAAEWQQKALALKKFGAAGEIAAEERLALYRAGKPFREPARK